MMRHLSIAIGLAATLVFSSSSSFAAEEAKFGTEEEAKAMLGKAVVALKEEQGESPRDVQQGRRRLQGPRLVCVLRQRLGRCSDRASIPQGRTLAGHRRQEGLSARARDHADCRGRENPSVTYWWPRPGTRKRRSRSTRSTRRSGTRSAGSGIQAVGVRHVHALSLFGQRARRPSRIGSRAIVEDGIDEVVETGVACETYQGRG